VNISLINEGLPGYCQWTNQPLFRVLVHMCYRLMPTWVRVLKCRPMAHALTCTAQWKVNVTDSGSNKQSLAMHLRPLIWWKQVGLGLGSGWGLKIDSLMIITVSEPFTGNSLGSAHLSVNLSLTIALINPAYLVSVPHQYKLGGLWQEGHLVKKWWGWQRWGTNSMDGMASSQIVSVSASVIFLCTIKPKA